MRGKESDIQDSKKIDQTILLFQSPAQVSDPLRSPRSSASLPHAPPLVLFLFLQCTHAVLLIDVPVSLLFLPVLENHGDAKNQNCVDADNAKSSREDQVQIAVGVG